MLKIFWKKPYLLRSSDVVRVWTVFTVFLGNSPQRLFSTSRIEQLNDKLKKNLEVAKNSDRKLLIIVGEGHENLHCRQVIFSLMDICRSLLSTSHLAVELNHRALPEMQSEKMKEKNLHHFLRKAAADEWVILPVDKHHDLKDEDCYSLGMSPMMWRNQGIVEELEAHLIEHGMMIVGAAHLYGLMRELKKIEKTHHVVYLNTLSFKGHPHQHALEFSWANDSKFVEQLTVAEIDEQKPCEAESVTRNKV